MFMSFMCSGTQARTRCLMPAWASASNCLSVRTHDQEGDSIRCKRVEDWQSGRESVFVTVCERERHTESLA